MIQVIIVEDEVNSRELIEQMLVNYCEEVKVLGTAVDVKSGIELIRGNARWNGV